MSQITITKLGTASAGEVSEVAISALHDEISSSVAPLRHPRFATAVRNGAGNLDVTVWESTDKGPVLVDKASAGRIHEIAVAGLNSSTFVTAMRDGSGDLRLILWKISKGDLVRKTHAVAGKVQTVAVTRLTSTRVVTAFSSGDTGNLGLIVWDYVNGELVYKFAHNAGTAYLVGVTRVSASRVVTASGSTPGSHKLTLIVWDIAADGKITRKESTMGNPLQALALNSLSNNQIATSISDTTVAGGTLRVDIWEVPADGTIHHKANASGVRTALVAGGDTLKTVFPTAVSDEDANLQLFAWDVASGIEKAAETPPSLKIGGLAAANLLPGEASTIFATASIKNTGGLEVATWQISPYDPRKQSPISLVTSQATQKDDPEAKPIYTGRFSSARVVKKFHVEDGHKSAVDVMMEIPWDSNPAAQVTLRIGQPDSTGTPQPTMYRVLQIHMHRDSEHTIGGVVYPLEMHCVLGDPGAANAGPKAVLGFLINKEGTENAGLSFYFDNLGQDDLTTVKFAPQDLNGLLPQDKAYFSYHGSLTSPSLDNTPLNATPILWYVLKNEISVSPGQFKKYEQAVEEHCRILQSNDSKVWLIKP